jgi:response regulator of citrate/malate metabolism
MIKQPPHILILDDNETLCTLIQNTFKVEPFNFNVSVANSFQDAQQFLNNFFDVIIVDVFLFNETETGLKFIEIYVKKYPNTKVVIITAYEDLTAKIDEHLIPYKLIEVKPFSLEAFSKKIYKLIFDKELTKNITKLDDTNKIVILQSIIDNIYADVDKIKNNINEIRINTIKQHEKIEYLEKEVVSIRTAVSTIMEACKNTQSVVVSFVTNHSSDGLKIVGAMTAIIVICLTILGMVLKCMP